MKLLGSIENKITKYKYGGNIPHLEITEVVSVHCHIVSSGYQQEVCTFLSNCISFGQLLEISTRNSILLKAFNSGFTYIEVCLTDKNIMFLEIEDRINITLVIR